MSHLPIFAMASRENSQIHCIADLPQQSQPWLWRLAGQVRILRRTARRRCYLAAPRPACGGAGEAGRTLLSGITPPFRHNTTYVVMDKIRD
jgi:hypothetical protein